MQNEPRQRLKSSSSIDTNHIQKTIKPTNNIAKIPAILVAKELSDIVVYTQAIKFRGEEEMNGVLEKINDFSSSIGLTCSPTSSGLAGTKSVRKPTKRNMQQLVAQPSTTSNIFIKENLRSIARKRFLGTESSRSIDQVSPSHQIISLIENKARKLSKNQGADMIT